MLMPQVDTGIAEPIPGKRGGARQGAGRKKASEQIGPYAERAQALAKLDSYKARLKELEYKQRAGELCELKDVESASSRMCAMIAQSLRTLPDDIERRCAVAPDVVMAVSEIIDELTLDIHEKFLELGGWTKSAGR